MTNLAAIDTDYRLAGNVPTSVIKQFLETKASPMLEGAEETNAAADPISALFWAMAYMENQWGTTGIILQPDDHNPVSMRPWREDPDGHMGEVIDWQTRERVGSITVSPHAIGAVRDRHGSYMLRFASDADAAREWVRRMTDDRYKGGVYSGARTLREMVDIYCPPGDVHPETGVNNVDIPYTGTVVSMLQRFAAEERFMTDDGASNNLIGDIVGELTEISGDSSFVEPAFLSYLENADPAQLVVRKNGNIFFRVGEEMVATRATPRNQRASANSLATGPDMEAGDTAFIEWAWIEPNGALWLYSDWATRFRGDDFVLGDGSSVTVPDTGPLPPVIEPPDDTDEITVGNFRLVEDPVTLLPPIIWEGSPNFFPGRMGHDPVAFVSHITDDLVYANTDSWFKNRQSNASSTFVIQRSGAVHQFVSSLDGPWTNGDVKQPRRDIPWMNDAIAAGINLNNLTITFEYVATNAQPPTEEQYRSGIALVRYFCHPKVYNINPNRSHHLRHSDINSVTRSFDPGPDFQLARIIRAAGGDPENLVD